MDEASSLSPDDLLLIRSLTYNPELEPNYEILKNCLVWQDEWPDGLTSAGHEFLCDLWIVRSYLHRQLDLSATLNPAYFENVWKRALKEIPSWPGFKRLSVTSEERDYYEKSIRNVSTFLLDSDA